jgi:hypothetical protein
VSAGLGGRDWGVIDPGPVRITKGSTRGRPIPALYYWRRTDSHVWCESQLEKDELMWLDYAGQVTRLWSQPFVVLFEPDVALGYHVPDFLVELTSGRLCLCDVKPDALIGDQEEGQFKATAAVSEQLGWLYRVLKNHPREQTRVLKWLWATSLDQCRPPRDVEARILEYAQGGATRAELSSFADTESPERGGVWVDYLAWHRRLRLDVGLQFGWSSVYTTVEENRS